MKKRQFRIHILCLFLILSLFLVACSGKSDTASDRNVLSAEASTSESADVIPKTEASQDEDEDIPEESEDVSEESGEVSEESGEVSEESGDISEESIKVPDKSAKAPEDSAEVSEKSAEILEESATGNIEITMLDVGQGLSILINADEEYMLYDGGGRQSSSYVVAYLKKNKIDHLKYLVASHYDEDHIAGLVGVLHTTKVDLALIPDYETDTNIYQSFMDIIDTDEVDSIYPELGETFTLGSSEFTIIGPDDYSTSDDNNNSIAIRGVLNDFSYILTGDAEEIEEFEIMNHDFDLDSTLYVAGHHGSQSSSGYTFLKEIDPEYVFISVGEGNTYNHPAESTMLRLKDFGVKMYRSDKQGEVTITSDGRSWKANKKKCKDWSDGSVVEEKVVPITPVDTAKETTEVTRSSSDEPATTTYILNTNTKKFHYPSCRSVDQMKDKNKAEEDTTRDDLIGRGFSPCGNCHP